MMGFHAQQAQPLMARAPILKPQARDLRPVAAAVIDLLLSSAALAQNAEDSTPATAATTATTTLPEVTVSASGTNRTVDDMTTPVTVLQGDALVQQRGASLGETLANEPGIQATHFGAGASRPVIRGMDGARVKVLNDGAVIQDASTISPDHAVVSEPMLATQIEVLRGPSALIYGAGAIGGVVNVLDNKIPTKVPEKGYEGQVEVRAGTGANDAATALSLTAGSGPFALHVEGMARNADDYRVGSGWGLGNKVDGSRARNAGGSIGLSWIGDSGYVGLAYTRTQARYGLPGHNHSFEGCHTHGLHLHCGGHDDHDHGEEGHDHDHEEEGVPVVDMHSERYDLRSEWRQPFAGVSAIRLRGGVTRYHHDEIEGSEISTSFKNRAHDMRVDVLHEPIAGWTGLVGFEAAQRRFSATGEEAYVQPTRTQSQGVYLLEERRFGDFGVEAALRHDWQSVYANDDGLVRKHKGNSVSLGGSWRFMPGYRLSAHVTSASRLPTAEELYARGLHMATSTYELGNPDLRKERSGNIDIGIARTAGDTTYSVNVYRNRVNNYIYGRTVDEHDGLQLLQYAQQTATFTGLEGQIQHRIDANWTVGATGDLVHAKLEDGSKIPRLAPARVGLRVAGKWANWRSEAQWQLVKRQNKVADYETETPGYGMLNWRVSYHQTSSDGTPWQIYLKLDNLTNKLAYVHTSFIKNAAPLQGRAVSLGFIKQF
ncbi:TonB-dependent receptor domain-containing protein [Comamonas sp. SY3]|uniref:TonB-dependent receptor domain-containing protein n=1 Tax=Comamonas sp. SY3 TaxID=3243601 RepID=UPI003593720B